MHFLSRHRVGHAMHGADHHQAFDTRAVLLSLYPINGVQGRSPGRRRRVLENHPPKAPKWGTKTDPIDIPTEEMQESNRMDFLFCIIQ